MTTQHAFYRYIKLSAELGLIKIIRNSIENTVDGQILSNLNDNNSMPFILPYPVKIFLLKLILEKDFDYITVLLYLSKIDQVTYSKFKQELEKKILIEPMNIINVDILNELRSWSSPKRYFRENIYAPRRSWLIDLDIASPVGKSRLIFRRDKNYLTKIMELSKKEMLYDYFNTKFIEDTSKYYFPNKRFQLYKYLNTKIQSNLVYAYLDNIFSRFNIVSDRISSKLFFNYTSIMLMYKDEIIAEKIDLENALLKISINSNYRYRPVTEQTITGEIIDTGYITKYR